MGNRPFSARISKIFRNIQPQLRRKKKPIKTGGGLGSKHARNACYLPEAGVAQGAKPSSLACSSAITDVYTEIVPDASSLTLQAIIRGKADVASIIHMDGWRGYDGLVNMGFDKHFRVHHSNNEFARGTHHVNGIESFWRFAKRRLAKFNGIARHTFEFHLKECEFHFNHRHDNLYRVLLKLLREQPLSLVCFLRPKPDMTSPCANSLERRVNLKVPSTRIPMPGYDGITMEKH